MAGRLAEPLKMTSVIPEPRIEVGRVSPEHPADGVHDVALPAPVRSDDAGEGVPAEVHDRPVGEGLEAEEFEAFEAHGIERCGAKRGARNLANPPGRQKRDFPALRIQGARPELSKRLESAQAAIPGRSAKSDDRPSRPGPRNPGREGPASAVRGQTAGRRPLASSSGDAIKPPRRWSSGALPSRPPGLTRPSSPGVPRRARRAPRDPPPGPGQVSEESRLARRPAPRRRWRSAPRAPAEREGRPRRRSRAPAPPAGPPASERKPSTLAPSSALARPSRGSGALVQTDRHERPCGPVAEDLPLRAPGG